MPGAGLTGTQGVLIPKANVQHLMLRRDVVEACAAGKFAVYPVATIDEGIALLTGLAAGERGTDGSYPASSVNRLVEDRLRAFASIRKSFGRQSEAALPARLIMAQQLEFRRIVLGCPTIRPNHGMRLAAEMARLLQLDLFGLFVEEESLCGLAALPFVREFQLLGGGWRPLDIERLSRDLGDCREKCRKSLHRSGQNSSNDVSV